jgi:hypothetical protein
MPFPVKGSKARAALCGALFGAIIVVHQQHLQMQMGPGFWSVCLDSFGCQVVTLQTRTCQPVGQCLQLMYAPLLRNDETPVGPSARAETAIEI